MKQLIRIVLAGILVCPLLVCSCSEEADCSMTGRPMMVCNVYQLDADGYAVRDTLDSLTVTAWGTDSIIINDQKNVMDLTLPLRYAVDSTVLVFRYSRHTTDTLVVRHVNTPYFVSMDCGYQMQQQIIDIVCTRHRLDSIYITYNEAGIYGQENVQLFY